MAASWGVQHRQEPTCCVVRWQHLWAFLAFVGKGILGCSVPQAISLHTSFCSKIYTGNRSFIHMQIQRNLPDDMTRNLLGHLMLLECSEEFSDRYGPSETCIADSSSIWTCMYSLSSQIASIFKNAHLVSTCPRTAVASVSA